MDGFGISHSWDDESFESKREWFQTLSMSGRLQLWDEFIALVLELNPSILDKKDAQPIPGRVHVLELPKE